MEETKRKETYIDVLRVLAMLGVIFLHTVATPLRGELNSKLWWACMIGTSICTISVLIFFMISGANILSSEKTKSISYLFKHRLPKLFFPLIFWSCVSVLKSMVTTYFESGNIPLRAGISEIAMVFNKPVTVHLWFMYTLIPLYLLSPVLKYLIEVLPEKIVKYMFWIWAALSIMYSVRAYFNPPFSDVLTVSFLSNLSMVNGYLGFFIFGYYFHKNKDKNNIKTPVLITSIIAMMAVITGMTYIFSKIRGRYTEQFTSYSGIYVFVLTILVFLLAQKINWKEIKILRFLSSVSFGVYLIHNIIISCLSTLKFNFHNAFSLALIYIITLCSSVLIIMILSSIKPLCYITSGMSYEQACNSCNFIFLYRKIFKRKQVQK